MLKARFAALLFLLLTCGTALAQDVSPEAAALQSQCLAKGNAHEDCWITRFGLEPASQVAARGEDMFRFSTYGAFELARVFDIRRTRGGITLDVREYQFDHPAQTSSQSRVPLNMANWDEIMKRWRTFQADRKAGVEEQARREARAQNQIFICLGEARGASFDYVEKGAATRLQAHVCDGSPLGRFLLDMTGYLFERIPGCASKVREPFRSPCRWPTRIEPK